MAPCIWTGASGKEYTYEIHLNDGTSNFDSFPANYIFAYHGDPVYIGETSNLKDRLERLGDHHKADCIQRAEATHIHVRYNSAGGEARRKEEADLVKKWDPPCNG